MSEIQKKERIQVVINNAVKIEQLIGILKLLNSSGREQSRAKIKVIKNWEIK